jgi:hypothetical protein
MAQHFLTLIEYSTIELHPLIIRNNWFLSSKEVATAFNVNLSKIIELLETLTEGKHYSYEAIEYTKNKTTSSILFFSKSGIIRLAYSLKSDDALRFLEFIEDINLKENEEEKIAHNFYNEIEDLLKERLDKIKKNPDTTLEEINHFILTLDNLVKKQKEITVEKSSDTLNISDILQTVVTLAQSYTTPKSKKVNTPS